MGAFEDSLRSKLDSAAVTREAWEAQWGEDAPPISDGQLREMAVLGAVNLQSQALPLLTFSEVGREELDRHLTRAREGQPARLEAEVFGPIVVTGTQLLRELPEQLRIHRHVIGLLVEQLDDGTGMLRGDVEGILDQADVPEEDDANLMGALEAAVRADRDAMLRLARRWEEVWDASP